MKKKDDFNKEIKKALFRAFRFLEVRFKFFETV